MHRGFSVPGDEYQGRLESSQEGTLKRRSLLVVAALFVMPGVPSPAAGSEPAAQPTRVIQLSGAPAGDRIDVTGTATFGGQGAVQVADDPANDANLTPDVTDRRGTEPGVDLLAAFLSVPSAATPELVVRWQVANLPAGGVVPEGVRYTFPFKVGSAVYVAQAKATNLLDPETAGQPQSQGAAFELRGNCTASFQGTGLARCDHLAWLNGSVDAAGGSVSVRIPLGSAAAPGITGGAIVRRNDSPNADLNDIIAGYQVGVSSSTPVDDRATFGPAGASSYSFTIPATAAALGTAPPGTDPRDVEYAHPATVSGETFAGGVPTNGLSPGTFDVFARACFGANCGYRSLGGATLALGDLVGALSLPQPGQPDRSTVFWQGGNVGDGVFYSLPSFLGNGVAGCTNSPCFTYKLRVDSPGAARLRIAIDASTRNDNFVLQVTRPDGGSQSATNSNAFNSEIFIDSPATGAYTVTVRPSSAENAEFALRARLERVIPARQPMPDGLIPPNLRPTAPYELGFAAPVLAAANGPFIAPDDANPPISMAGHGVASCTPDEMADDQAVRCLRFSFGLSNTGPGAFTIRGPGNAQTPQPLYQCVERADGSVFSRPAGTQQFHQEHLHNHYQDLIQMELLKVTDPQAGTMTPTGDGRKLGYNPADQSIADWNAFNQELGSTLACDGGGVRFELSIGWGDVYRYQRLGNFVDFGTNTDGLYVVRLKIDPLNNVLEANESDNTSYTYIRVTLDQVEVLEYGRGQSPWDPNKDVLQLRRKAGVPW